MSFALHSAAHLQVAEEGSRSLAAFYLLFAWVNIVTAQNASVNIRRKVAFLAIWI
jgi:hypothetical protein